VVQKGKTIAFRFEAPLKEEADFVGILFQHTEHSISDGRVDVELMGVYDAAGKPRMSAENSSNVILLS
jgi:hypothetical protein